MRITLQNYFRTLLHVDKEEQLKTFFLSAVFFLIIFSYTLIKELKDSVFMGIIGTKNYVPAAKILTILALVPLVFFYSKLVDTVRRYQLLAICATFYGLLGLVCTYLIGHPEIGLHNAETGPYRIFGWIFYLYVESFSPFVLSVFWAFLNSVSSPKAAKNNYGILISFSKIGGMLSSGIGWLFLYNSGYLQAWGMTDIGLIQSLMFIASVFLMFVPLLIVKMIRTVPGQYLHGYEAAYQFEKQQSKAGKEQSGMFSGLTMLLKYPYTFGIFGLVLFYEIINSVLSFQRLGVAQTAGGTVAGTTCFLLGLSFTIHFVAFFISLFGTRVLVSKLGERLSLMIMPISMGIMVFYYLYSSSPWALMICFILIRAVYYAFNQPVTEALYIPTVKAVKFKSKTWIDTFGKKIAKGVGSVFNVVSAVFGQSYFHLVHSGLFGIVIVCWTVVAYFLGQRHAQAIKNQEVIGSEEAE